MSWAEVTRINSNLGKPLDEHITDSLAAQTAKLNTDEAPLNEQIEDAKESLLESLSSDPATPLDEAVAAQLEEQLAAINSNPAIPLDKKIERSVGDAAGYVNDYKMYGLDSYTYQDKRLLEKACLSKEAANDKTVMEDRPMNEEFFSIVLAEGFHLGKFLAQIYGIDETVSWEDLDTTEALGNGTDASDTVYATPAALVLYEKYAPDVLIGKFAAHLAGIDPTTVESLTALCESEDFTTVIQSEEAAAELMASDIAIRIIIGSASAMRAVPASEPFALFIANSETYVPLIEANTECLDIFAEQASWLPITTQTEVGFTAVASRNKYMEYFYDNISACESVIIGSETALDVLRSLSTTVTATTQTTITEKHSFVVDFTTNSTTEGSTTVGSYVRDPVNRHAETAVKAGFCGTLHAEDTAGTVTVYYYDWDEPIEPEPETEGGNE